MLRHIARAAALLGTGLTAGLAGTAVMTAVQTVEMKVSGREGSSMPAPPPGSSSEPRRSVASTNSLLSTESWALRSTWCTVT